MTVVFVSNYFNHHQAPFAAAMDKLTKHRFHFVETCTMDSERKSLGWGGDSRPDYVLQAYLDPLSEQRAKDMIMNAGVVIWGSCPFSLIRPRLKAKKLTFAYSERLFKDNNLFRCVARAIKHYLRLRRYRVNHYMLCASAYAASDYAKLGLFRGKCYKWGYFPETKRYDDLDKLIAAKQPGSILWVARFIDWKHPEIPLEIARRLKQEGYKFTLNMIGNGELLEATRKRVEALGLDDCVHLPGSMSPEDVRRYMEQSQVFLFTSDRNEGWGAVLNESMNSACAVVASRAIGSVPFLVEDGVNGDIYEDGNIDDLYRKVKALLDDPARRVQKCKNVYTTITGEWNAEVAAGRLLKVMQKAGQDGASAESFSAGPCSMAAKKYVYQ